MSIPTIDDFKDNDLPLLYYNASRRIIQTFKSNQTSATARLLFDFMMLNFSKHLNHTHEITIDKMCNWLEVSEGAAYRALRHLKETDIVRPHPVKRNRYIIPSVSELSDLLADYRLAKKEAEFQERLADRIDELTFDFGRALKDIEIQHIEKEMRRDIEYKRRSEKKKQDSLKPKLPFE